MKSCKAVLPMLLVVRVENTPSFWYGVLLTLLVMTALVGYYFWKYRHLLRTASVDQAKVQRILQLHFAYYNLLPAKAKPEFEQRVIRFVSEKEFIPRNFKQVSLEMRVLIAASAVQLTFGLPEITLQHFDKILIYPQQYYSVITRQHHKGEVNPKAGAIVLSWSNFVEGYALPNDSFNLGLHEMAHALKLENVIQNNEYGFLQEDMLAEWQLHAHAAMQAIRQDNQSFFRDYAATNEEEFFAVAIENFFERPTAFQQQFPALYGTLVSLLKQDPLHMQI